MINSRSIWDRLAITWKKKRPAGVLVSTPSVMLWKCTFWVSSSLARSTNPFTLRPSRSSFQTTRVSASRKWDSASFSPGRSTCAPLSLSEDALASCLVERVQLHVQILITGRHSGVSNPHGLKFSLLHQILDTRVEDEETRRTNR